MLRRGPFFNWDCIHDGIGGEGRVGASRGEKVGGLENRDKGCGGFTHAVWKGAVRPFLVEIWFDGVL